VGPRIVLLLSLPQLAPQNNTKWPATTTTKATRECIRVVFLIKEVMASSLIIVRGAMCSPFLRLSFHALGEAFSLVDTVLCLI
jgi:hypothetical protein